MLKRQGNGRPTARPTPNPMGGSTQSTVKRTLDQAVDVGLAGVIFVAPLVMGGRHPIGRFVLICFVALSAVAWVCRQCLSSDGRWRWSGVEWLMLAGASLILFQLVSLPVATLVAISPHLADLMPAWTEQADSAVRLGTWSRISLTPSETMGGLVMYVAYGTLFLLVVQRIKALEDVERLLRWIAVAVTGMAVVGIAQRFAGNGHFLWLYEHPFRDTQAAVKGAFINENHFAHFLALGIAPLLWWLHRSRQTDRPSTEQVPQLAIGVAMAVVAVAGLLTFSRGGVVVMFLAGAVSAGIYARAGLLQRNTVLALGSVGLFAGVALLIYGSAPLIDELATLGAGSVEDVDRFGTRRKLWAADLTAASHFPLLGTGIGSHAEIYPTFFEHRFDLEYTHAENGYLQVLLESGVTGLLLLLTGIAACCRWSFGALWGATSSRVTAAATVVVTALTISLVHSIWDFVWYLPACMSLTIILMACSCRLYQLELRRRSDDRRDRSCISISRPVWAIGAVAATLLAAAIIHDRLSPALAAPHWDRYMRLVASLNEQEETEDAEAPLAGMIDALQKTVDHDPRSTRAHARLGNLLLRYFDRQQIDAVNSVQLNQLRQATRASRFPTRQAQDAWLAVAIGDKRRMLDKAVAHIRRSLALCPVQGESYADLAELGFLEGRADTETQAILDQALDVRPYSDDVRFAVGAHLAAAGDLTGALPYWKAPFQRSPSHRWRIIEVLADEALPARFVEYFEPDSNGLGDLFAFYQQEGRYDAAGEVGERYATALEEAASALTREEAARQWLEAYNVHRFLENSTAAKRCVENAVKAAPDDYQPRLKLAILLIDLEQYGPAIEQLNWCQRRKPRDQVVRNCLQRARIRQLRQAANIMQIDRQRN